MQGSNGNEYDEGNNASSSSSSSSRYYGSIPVITMLDDDDNHPHQRKLVVQRRSSSIAGVVLIGSFMIAGLIATHSMLFLGTGPQTASIATSLCLSNRDGGHRDHHDHDRDHDHHRQHKSSSGSSSHTKEESKSISDILVDPKYDEMELYYDEQYVDHIYVDTEHADKKKKKKGSSSSSLPTYSQRYYKKSKYWGGPGYPILVVLGGEDALELPMLYPFVHEGLASQFRALTISPEHRFYGESQPISNNPDIPADFIRYLTPDQALLDTVNLIQYIREQLGCNMDRSSPDYCPVITFGGSYPGFLSAMMRFRFPDVVDVGYASSAPLELYSQVVDSNAYYDKVTEVADMASPGCKDAVSTALYEIRDSLLGDEDDTTPGYDSHADVKDAASSIGVCPDTLPKYISEYNDVYTLVSEAVVYLVPAIFADFNMAYYPPSDQTALFKACAIFQQEDKTAFKKLREFYELRNEVEYGADDEDDDGKKGGGKKHKKKSKCFDLNLELPAGKHARIMGADWSGSGGGMAGEVWEFQCCKDLIIRAGYSPQSMFIDRPWSYFWHQEHCHRRFPGVPVEPFRMVNQWHFNDIVKTGSKILFANGLNDGWSTSSILDVGNNNTNLAVINFPNGAHHSELSHMWPNENDTADIKAGYDTVADTLSGWLKEISPAASE